MTPSIQVRMAIMSLLIGLALAAPPSAPAAQSPCELHTYAVEQLQLAIRPGGRANTIAVHPNNNNFILVASESGGLFRSQNGGKTWYHQDNLPVFYTNAVAYAKDPKFVIVTASEDFSVSNRGGIWRSSDEGATWTQVPSPSAPPWAATPPFATTKRLSAYEISIAPDTGRIYVASNYGVLISDDPQGKTWSKPPLDPFADLVGASVDRRVLSVVALPVTAQGCGGNPGGGNLVLAGGRAGIRRSPDGGDHWCKPKQSTDCNPDPAHNDDAGCIMDMHAFGRSPVAKDQAYVVAPSYKDDQMFMQLYHTTNGGDTWTLINTETAKYQITAGGIGFVKAIKRAGSTDLIDLYVSNRISISKGVTDPVTALWGKPYQWATFIEYPTTSEAGDTRDLAFSNQNEPILAATDGGLITPSGGGLFGTPHWMFAGNNGQGNPPNGYNALQIYEVKGQWIDDIYRHDLYFGTQDNSLWSTGGFNWGRCCNEGGFFEGDYHVPTSSDSQITFSTGFDPKSNFKLKGLLFTTDESAGVDSWTNPPLGPASGWPKIISKNLHVQGVESFTGEVTSPFGAIIKVSQKRGLAITTNLGQTWKQWAIIDEDRADLPRLSTPDKGTPVLYQVTREGFDATAKADNHGLARVVKKKNAEDASVSYPLMKNFGDFGWGPTMNTNYRVFSADPRHVNHLIASDTTSGKMMETTNGGNDWTEIPQLTPLVTDGGQLNFLGGVFFNGTIRDHVSAQASAISFYPDDPNMVAVGTVQNGIFVSSDGGKTWRKAPGLEKATLISSLHWRTAHELYVSTYGRGLWRVLFNCVTHPDKVPCKSPGCFHIYYEKPPGQRPSPYDHLAVAYGGPIVGARVTRGIVNELFVQPGTTIVFAADLQQVPNIKVTETMRPIGFLGVTTMPRPPEGARVITGLTLRKRGEESELAGFQFSPGPRSMYTAEETGEAEERPVGRIESPTAGKPYLEVLTGSVTSPGSTIQLAGRNLQAGKPVEIAVDGNTVKRVAADRTGKFSTTMKAPTQFGLHTITLIDSASRNVLDGAMVSVRPEDAPRSRF